MVDKKIIKEKITPIYYELCEEIADITKEKPSTVCQKIGDLDDLACGIAFAFDLDFEGAKSIWLDEYGLLKEDVVRKNDA